MAITISGSGTVTGLSAGGISNTKAIASAAMPAGSVIQTIQSTKTDTASYNSTTWADIAGTDQAGSGSIWCVKITPASASNKILIQYNIKAGNTGSLWSLKILRDSTQIYKGDTETDKLSMTEGMYGDSGYGAHYDVQTMSGMYLDSPSSTSELTYKIQWKNAHGSGYYNYLNRAGNGDDTSVYNGRYASTLTCLEIVG